MKEMVSAGMWDNKLLKKRVLESFHLKENEVIAEHCTDQEHFYRPHYHLYWEKNGKKNSQS